MQPVAEWQRWGRTAVIGLVAGLIAWFAFVLARPVPVLDLFDLAIHEAGHLLLAFLPMVAVAAAGSAAQVIFPLAMAVYFGLRRRDMAAAGFCLVWAGTSAWDVSVYAADAVSQSLPTIGGGIHDWAYLLGHFDALDHTAQIAGVIESFGGLLAAAGFAAIALSMVPARHRTAPPVPIALPTIGDPWLAASRLPFHHEGVTRQGVGFSTGAGGSGAD